MARDCCPDSASGYSLGSRPLAAGEEATARVFKALGDPVRLTMLAALAATLPGAICACDFVAITGKAQPTVSHHLKVLREAGLVEAERRGTWIWYRLEPGGLARARDFLALDGSQVPA